VAILRRNALGTRSTADTTVMDPWYFDLADGEGMNRGRVLHALITAVHKRLKEEANRFEMGMRLTNLKPLLSVSDVAAILGRDEETVRRYARKHILTTVSIPGGAILFDPEILLKELNGFLRPSKFASG